MAKSKSMKDSMSLPMEPTEEQIAEAHALHRTNLEEVARLLNENPNGAFGFFQVTKDKKGHAVATIVSTTGTLAEAAALGLTMHDTAEDMLVSLKEKLGEEFLSNGR